MNADGKHTQPDGQVALNLADYFSPNTPADWRAEAEAYLQGAPFDRKLKTPIPEGIDLEPIYFAGDAANSAGAGSYPGLPPYVRGARPEGTLGDRRAVCGESYEALAAEANRYFKDSIERGQNALRIPLDRASAAALDVDQADPVMIGCGGLSLNTVEDMRTLLEGLPLAAVSLHFHPGVAALPLSALLKAALEASGMNPQALRGGIHYDPLGEAARRGPLPWSLDTLLEQMQCLLLGGAEAFPEFYTIGVSGLPYANAGAGAERELGAVLATGVAYLRALSQRGLEVDLVAPRMAFEFAMGPHFFTEIAKLRAARMLWHRVMEACGATGHCGRMRIHSMSASWNKSLLDPHTNLLRTTTEALASVIGGVDGMCIHPFDATAGKPSDRSRRIARNTQIILGGECNLDKVIDPAGGSYYLEKLTDELCARGWAYFQQIEQAGGMEQALADGWIARDIADVARQRMADVARGKSSLVGVNLHPVAREKIPHPQPCLPQAAVNERIARLGQLRDVAAKVTLADIPRGPECLQSMGTAAANGATLGMLAHAFNGDTAGWSVIPLQGVRAAAAFEDLRAAADACADKQGKRPAIFLANIGPLRNHKMRMDFTRGMFEVGGFDLIAGTGSTDPLAVARECVASGASTAVICGSDGDYPEFVPAFLAALKPDNPGIRVLLAGHPGEHEAAYSHAGLDDFIFIKTSVYDANLGCLRHCGAID